MKFEEAKSYILSRLRHELPTDLYYHGLHHTLDVCESVEEPAQAEQINGDSLVLLKTAAVFHDSGFLERYVNNEPVAVTFARKGRESGRAHALGTLLPGAVSGAEEFRAACDARPGSGGAAIASGQVGA